MLDPTLHSSESFAIFSLTHWPEIQGIEDEKYINLVHKSRICEFNQIFDILFSTHFIDYLPNVCGVDKNMPISSNVALRH